MKGYGLPRCDDVANPDKSDGGLYGLKGFKLNTKKKRSSRRIWKRKARMIAQKEIQNNT